MFDRKKFADSVVEFLETSRPSQALLADYLRQRCKELAGQEYSAEWDKLYELVGAAESKAFDLLAAMDELVEKLKEDGEDFVPTA